MKKLEMKKLVDSQRHILVAMCAALRFTEEDTGMKLYINDSIDKLWSLSEELNESFRLNAKEFDEIMQEKNNYVGDMKFEGYDPTQKPN